MVAGTNNSLALQLSSSKWDLYQLQQQITPVPIPITVENYTCPTAHAAANYTCPIALAAAITPVPITVTAAITPAQLQQQLHPSNYTYSTITLPITVEHSAIKATTIFSSGHDNQYRYRDLGRHNKQSLKLLLGRANIATRREIFS